MTEKMAIVKDVGFGNRDIGRPCLFFSVYINESVGSLQVFEGKKALQMIQNSEVYDIKELEGKPCWIEEEGNTIKFLKWCKI
jgi:hypothetical protein